MTLVSRTASAPRAQALGQAMVLMSATAFGTLAIFAKLGYANGLGTQQLLAFRFVLAALGMAAVAFLLGQNILRLRRKDVAILLAMGGLLYTVQSLTYFLALRTLPASLVVLIAYIYPSLVVVAGWLFLHRSIAAWHLVALMASFAGVALLSTWEPVVTVILAVALLRDRLSWIQVIGGFLVLLAVVSVQMSRPLKLVEPPPG